LPREFTFQSVLVAAQVPTLQPIDVSLGFVDIASQRRDFALGTVVFQPDQSSIHVAQQIAQSPDQRHGLGRIVFTHLTNRCTLEAICEPAGKRGMNGSDALKIGPSAQSVTRLVSPASATRRCT